MKKLFSMFALAIASLLVSPAFAAESVQDRAVADDAVAEAVRPILIVTGGTPEFRRKLELWLPVHLYPFLLSEGGPIVAGTLGGNDNRPLNHDRGAGRSGREDHRRREPVAGIPTTAEQHDDQCGGAAA